MRKLKFLFDEEEEKEKFGWKQRTRDIGELPEIPESTKLKFTADVGLGIGAKAEMGITLPEPTPKIGVTQRMRGIGEIPKKYSLEGITTELSEVNKRRFNLWWSEFRTTEDKWKFIRHENWSPELIQLNRESMMLSGQASKLGVNTGDWIEYGAYTAFFATMAAGILPILKGLPTEVLNKLTYKVEGKTVKGKELFNAIRRVAYPDPHAGFGKPSTFDKEIFRKFTEKGGLKGLGGSLEKGIEITKVTPRFAFGTKLYAGLPADEIVRSLVETGKVTADISRELSLAKPELVSQVIQNLSIASPAIASKLAPELTKLIPKVEPKITEIRKLTKTERKILESPVDLGEGKVTFSWAEIAPKARKKAITKLEELGYVKGTLLTEKGIELANVLKARIEAEEKGIPVAEKEIKRPITDKQLAKISPNEELILGKIEGVDFYTDTRVMLKGKPKEDIPISKNKPDFEQIVVDLPKEETKVKPTIFSKKGDLEPLVWFDNKVAITERYYDLILKKFPEAEFRSVEKIVPKEPIGKAPIKIYEKDEFVGVVMPYRQEIEDIPERVLEKIAPKPPIEPPEKVEEVKRVEPVVREEIPKVEIKEPIKPVIEKPVPKPEVKRELIEEEIPKVEVATPKQIKKAHAIANSKALISEKGKMKPQYRKIAEVFTGKRSVKDMTPEEAEMFIDQLNRLPEPKYRAGKLVPPSIPRTMKLTTLDFFKKVYGEPTPIWLLTDQTYYATKLGIKPLVEPYEKGKMGFDLEFRKSSHLVDKMVNKLNAIAKTPGWERVKSKIKNIPTKAESNMAELVNKYETTPPGLSPKEEDVFKYFRNLSKDIWRRENEVREKVDLPPIEYKKAYFRHTADAMAKEMLEGKYPFPQGIKYWGEKMVGKKIFNPMEFHRKLSDDLIDLWSKDIRAVTKSMLWNGLKEIYLAQPAKFLNEQLNAISKDLPEYRNLSPRDQAAYDQTRVIPSSTRKWLVDYINQVLKGQETELDASLNRIVTKSGLKGIFDKALSPFGRSIGRKPITNTFMLSGRAVISGVMGWIPRQIMRNAFQPVQNLALYGVKATIKSYLPASVDKNLKGLMSESLFLKSYTGFEELPTNLMGKLEKVWLGPYGIVAVNNAKLGMKAAYWNTLELIKNPKFRKHGWADSQRTKDTPREKLYPSEKEKLLREMEFGASATQYQYIPIGMPGIFRYKALVPATRLQSWWMNYFTKFLRESTHRAFKGRPSWSGEDGPTLPWSRRVNFLKYLILGGWVLTTLGYRKSFLLGVAPTYLSPAMQLALGMYNYAIATEDWKRKKALNQIYYSWKAFIPGSLAWRDFIAVWNGEKDLEEILFYGKKEEKKVQPPLKITIPKGGKLKFIEIKPKKSTKLKFTF